MTGRVADRIAATHESAYHVGVDALRDSRDIAIPEARTPPNELRLSGRVFQAVRFTRGSGIPLMMEQPDAAEGHRHIVFVARGR